MAISIVQSRQVAAADGTVYGAPSMSFAFSSAVTSSNLLVAAVTVGGVHGSTWMNNLTCSDSINGSWIKIGSGLWNTSNEEGFVFFYKYNTSAGSPTITFSWTDGVGTDYTDIHLIEISGCASAYDPIDGSAYIQRSGSTSVTTSSITTTGNGNIVIAAFSSFGGISSCTAGSGWTQIQAFRLMMTEYQIQSTAGAISATATAGNTNNCGTGIVAFKAAGVPLTATVTESTTATDTVAANATIYSVSVSETTTSSDTASATVKPLPSISSVSGITTHGQTITISGSGFGTKATAAPAFYDTVNYPTLANGDVIPVGGANLWPATAGNVSVYYKTTNTRGKQTAFYSNQWSTNDFKKGALDGVVVTGAKTSKKLYLSWWLYCSSDPSVNGTNASNKWIRLDSGTWNTPGEGSIIWEPKQLFSFAFPDIYLPGNHFVDWNGVYPGWNRMEMFADSTTSNNPDYSAWCNGQLIGHFNSTPNQSWVVDILGAMGFDGSNTPAVDQPTVEWGEIYADNTIARVELGNSSTYNACTHKEIQPPTTWSDTSTAITLNQGTFADGATVYLYVVDSNGATNSTGFAVTLSSTVQTASITESATAADTVSAVTAYYPVTVSEIVSATDTVGTGSMTHAVSLTEPTTASDAPSIVITYSISRAEAATAADVGSYGSVSVLTVTETASAVDTLDLQMVWSGVLSETTTATDFVKLIATDMAMIKLADQILLLQLIQAPTNLTPLRVKGSSVTYGVISTTDIAGKPIRLKGYNNTVALITQ